MGFVILLLRVCFIATNEDIKNVSANQSKYTLKINKTRGQFYDCNFKPIVNNETQNIVCIYPTKENIEVLKKTQVVDMPKEIPQKPFIASAKTANVNIPQVDCFEIEKRYGKGQIAQHIIGYCSGDKGVCGLEKVYDTFLTGGDSTITYTVDGHREILKGLKPQVEYSPFCINGVMLSIDADIQRIVEEIGNAGIEKGAIVIMNPYDGRIKACASFPLYNANDLGRALKDEGSPLINRAFCAYPVGSTFKLVTAATALKQGITPTYCCNGNIKIDDVTFGCHNKAGHGELDLCEALKQSCNPYFINLSQQLDRQLLLDTASDLSFGKRNIFAEGFETAKGVIPQIEEISLAGQVGNLSFGQGRLTATPIQIAQMTSAIINKGKLYNAVLVEGITEDGQAFFKKEKQRPPLIALDSDIADTLKEHMVKCVMETENQNALPYTTTAGGKTATAQTGQFSNGEELLQGWFTGFFPADKPKYVVTVTVEESKSGNTDASPIFQRIADKITRSDDQ